MKRGRSGCRDTDAEVLVNIRSGCLAYSRSEELEGVRERSTGEALWQGRSNVIIVKGEFGWGFQHLEAS